MKYILALAFLLTACQSPAQVVPDAVLSPPKVVQPAPPPVPAEPMYPISVKSSDGKILATIGADGSISGDYNALVALLKDQRGQATEQSAIIAIVAHELKAQKAKK